MKVFFDTNVYVAEALLGGAVERMVEATSNAPLRVFTNRYVLEETKRVIVERLGLLSPFCPLDA